MLFVAMAVGCVLVLGPGMVAAVVAHRKGYRPWFWVLSFGLIGLVVTVMIPALRKAETPELRERWENRADWTGGILSSVTFMLMFVFPLMGGLLFVGVVAPMGGPPVAIPAPPVVSPPLRVEPEVLDAEKTEGQSAQPEVQGE